MEEAGYETQIAESATEAWTIIHKEKPALILLDLLMPRVSGFQMLEKLKQKEDLAAIPVVVVSALNDRDTINTLREMGADDFFAKPLDIKKLVKRVNDFLID